jgi:hypothetical protein
MGLDNLGVCEENVRKIVVNVMQPDQMYHKSTPHTRYQKLLEKHEER